MVASGGGSIVAMGSTLGSIVAPQYAAYCASKFGLTNLCKQVAIEHAPDGVRVNVLSLGPTDTGLFVRLTDMAPGSRAGARRRRGEPADAPARSRRRGVRRGVLPRVRRRRVHERRGPSRSTAGSRHGGCDVTVDGFRVLDADAHVVEPAEVFAAWTDNPLPGRPSRGHAARTVRRLRARGRPVRARLRRGVVRARHGRAGHRRGRALSRRSACSCPYLPQLTPDESAAACRSYNDWIADYCAHEPSRMTAAGLVPLADVDLAVAEAQAGARSRSRRRDGAAQPPVRTQPRRPRLRPVVGRVLGPRAHGVGARGTRLAGPDDRHATGSRGSPAATRCRIRWSRWRRWRRSCSTARSNVTRSCGSRSSSRARVGCRTGWRASTIISSG